MAACRYGISLLLNLISLVRYAAVTREISSWTLEEMIRSHDKELITLGHKLRSETLKIKESRAGLVRVPLYWKFHRVI